MKRFQYGYYRGENFYRHTVEANNLDEALIVLYKTKGKDIEITSVVEV